MKYFIYNFPKPDLADENNLSGLVGPTIRLSWDDTLAAACYEDLLKIEEIANFNQCI